MTSDANALRSRIGRVHTVKSESAKVQALRNAQRAQVCVGPKYPDGPDAYRYVVSESCVHKDKDKAKQTRRAKPTFTVRQNKKELEVIQKALRAYDNTDVVSDDQAPGTLTYATTRFQLMIDAKNRAQFPDPLERYEHVTSKQRPKLVAHVRQLVLHLTRAHLLALTPSEAA